nr:hypothetical protein [Tanacetum cinerariifolium]
MLILLHPPIARPKYEAFYDDHVKEISSGSPTTHSDSCLYESFIFDLSINPFPPADRSDFHEFVDELIHFISPPEYDCFLFKIETNSRDFTMDVVEDISPTREPRVHNASPTHPTLQLNLKFQPSSKYLFTYVVWIFLLFLVYLVAPRYLLSLRNEYTIFDPGIYMEDLKQQYLDEMKRLINSEYRDEIKIDELKGNFNSMSIEINKKEKLQQLEQDYNFAITPNEPVNSLSMGDEHPDTILATKSDEFIKSSVENLVPIPSESGGESECDVPICEEFTTFPNVLFDADYEFDSSDNQSFYDEDIPEKIFLNPLFEEEITPIKIDQHPHNVESDLIESLRIHDSSLIISSKIDSLFDEFVGDLALLKSILPGIDEADYDPEEDIRLIEKLLYDNSYLCLPEEFVSDNSDAEIESFSPSPIPLKDSDSLMEEIDLSFTLDYPMPPGIEDDDYDSERDILIFEDLPSNDTLSIPEIESFHFDIPSFSRPPAKPPDGNTIILNVKMMGDISDQKVPMPKLKITLASNPKKSHNLLSHQGLQAFLHSATCPMMIHGKNNPLLDVSLFHFYPP